MAKKEKIVNSDGTVDEVLSAFPEKWAKKITHWVGIAEAMDDAELKKTIVECEGNIYTIDKEKAADVKLKAAKEVVKENSGPYAEAAGVQTAKIKFALFLLENRGVDLDTKDTP